MFSKSFEIFRIHGKDAAIEVFLHSVEKRGLKYTNYIGDGDSSSYGTVAQVLKEKYFDQ